LSLYLLDTNIWIALARGESAAVSRLRRLAPTQVASCSVVRAELMFGARKSRHVAENLDGFRRLLAPFVSLEFDDRAADLYGMVRAMLQAAGTPSGGNDLLIASIALANDCTLITRDVEDFERVPGLKLITWPS
jgi:tRNA(fMet)-specific endonuclease VapC